MVSWIEDRATGELATGKYEITIAPHVWYKYATVDQQADAHGQITTCTCSANGLLYTEQKPERIGMEDKLDAFVLENPVGTCSNTSGSLAVCLLVVFVFIVATFFPLSKGWG